jgi:hypothetical protein
VRVAAARDVYLEEAKDTALAMYSRESAMKVLDRIRGAAGFDALTEERARAMGPDVLVTERTMNLPLSDYAADSLQRRSLIRSVGRPTLGDEQTFAVAQDVWNTWKGMLARRA